MTEIDRDPLIDELRAALDVAPSAEFAARVRRAVDAWRPRVWWRVAAGTAFAATALAGELIFLPGPVRHQAPQDTASASSRQASIPAPVGSSGVTAASARMDAVVTGRHRKTVSVARDASAAATVDHDGPKPDLEVLVPKDEGMALSRLMAALRAHTALVPPATRPAEDADGLLLAPDPVAIPALSIAPLSGPNGRAAQEKSR
jgi:hypothetical protein